MLRSVENWEQELGDQVRRLRISKNLTQSELAARANIAKDSLARLEGGKGSTTKTLISALKALDETAWLSNLASPVTVDPIQIAELGKERQRVRHKRITNGV